MADRTLSLIEIAERLGFSDLSSFSQAFKRWFGAAPSAHCSRYGGAWHLPSRGARLHPI